MPSVHQKRLSLLEDLKRLTPLEDAPSELRPGVLYSNWIRYFCDERTVPGESRLIREFDEDKMHCAGYKLSVGNEYYLGDRHYCLPGYQDAPEFEASDWLEIPPFQVAVVKTQEVLCIPRFLIARWNLVVKLAYRGLLWVGAAQVDPGYVGHLFCPIYNLSDQPVRLDKGDDIALVDFVVTTPFPYKSCTEQKKWIRQPLTDKPIIEDYVPQGLRSALFTDAAQRVKEVEGKIEALDRRTTLTTQITVAALAVIPALIVTMLPFEGAATITASIWAPFAVGLSVFAAGLAAFNSISNYLMVRSGLLRERWELRFQPRMDSLTKEARGRLRKAIVLAYAGMHLAATATAVGAAVWLGLWTFDLAHDHTSAYIRSVAEDRGRASLDIERRLTYGETVRGEILEQLQEIRGMLWSQERGEAAPQRPAVQTEPEAE